MLGPSHQSERDHSLLVHYTWRGDIFHWPVTPTSTSVLTETQCLFVKHQIIVLSSLGHRSIKLSWQIQGSQRSKRADITIQTAGFHIPLPDTALFSHMTPVVTSFQRCQGPSKMDARPSLAHTGASGQPTLRSKSCKTLKFLDPSV